MIHTSLFFCLLTATAFSQATVSAIRNAAANTWVQVSNTRMDAADPCPARNCSYSGVEGVSAVMNDWCGGVFDPTRNRLVVWGGGHNGYYGNELYAFEIDSLKWVRLTNPSTSITFGQDPMANGMPLSRHTYGGMAYLSHVDRLFAMGGSGANNGYAIRNTWGFDFDLKAWTSKGSCGFGAGLGSTCAYDPATRKVYWAEGNNSDYNSWGMHSYDYGANQWTRLDDTRPYYNAGSAFDTKRGLFIIVGGGHTYVYYIKNGNFTAQDWATTGGSAFISKSAVGLDYDPVADQVVGWHGGSVYALNPDTKVWTVHAATGAPVPNSNGTYGRWRYVPSVNAFIAPNRTDQNVYFYKLTAGSGVQEEGKGQRADGKGRIHIFPNPVRSAAAIRIAGAPEASSKFGSIQDTRGRLIARFSGAEFTWKSRGVPNGVYIATARVGGMKLIQKFLVQK